MATRVRRPPGGSPAPSGGGGAAHTPSSSSFAVDSIVGYEQRHPTTGKPERLAVRLKHVDRTMDPPAYTIELPGGGERQTERHRLHVLRPGEDDVGAQHTDLASQQLFDEQLAARPPRWRYSWLGTLLAALVLLAATVPSEASLVLYLTTRRDPSTLGQVRHSVKGLWASLLGTGASPESERVTSFASYGALSLAAVADGRSFVGMCGIWLEAPSGEALSLSLPSADDLQSLSLGRVADYCAELADAARLVGSRGLASWSSHAAHDLYALAAVNVAVWLLWSIRRDSWRWQGRMRKHFTVSRRNLSAWRFHTLLSSAFSHEDLYHLAHNMMWLLAVGPEMQAQLGREQTLLLYLAGGVGTYCRPPAPNPN
jgi:hypothetical protein